MNSKGFTLIETTVVMAIIGLLASFAIPNYLEAKKAAQAASVIADIEMVMHAALLCYSDTGKFPDDSYPGRTPKELEPYLPEGFDFSRLPEMDARYDWENWSGEDGNPVWPWTGVSYGISLTSTDDMLIRKVMGLYGGKMIASVNDNYTFVLAGYNEDE